MNKWIGIAKGFLQEGAIPLSAHHLEAILRKVTPDIQELSVTIHEEIRVTGKAKKMLVNVPFEIRLKPERAEGRKLYFKITHFSPLNMEWVKKAVFHKPPHLTYGDDVAVLNLNEVEQIRKIPLGSVKQYYLKDSQLWVALSL